MEIFYSDPRRWDERYRAEIEAIWHERPVYVQEVAGVEKFSRRPTTYVAYSLSRKPRTTDEWWIVGSSHEAMVHGKLIAPDVLSGVFRPVGCVFEAYDEWAYKVFRPGERDDERKDGFASEEEAWAAVEAKYPAVERVEHHAEYIGRREHNLKAMGTDFKAEAIWWR